MKVETGMDTFLVTLADRQTGEDQRILVMDKNPALDMQDWIDAHKNTFDPPLRINDPVVVHSHKLKIKRPLPKTTMSTAVKVAV